MGCKKAVPQAGLILKWFAKLANKKGLKSLFKSLKIIAFKVFKHVKFAVDQGKKAMERFEKL